MSQMLRRLFVLLLFVLVLWLLARHTSLFPTLNNPFSPKQIVVDETPLLVTQIKSIAQLMTLEAYNEVVVDSTRYPFGIPPQAFSRIPGHPLNFLSASQLVLIVRGKVVAGVDLASVNQNNIQIKADSLFVQIPRAQVLDVITNPSDIETFIEKGTWENTAATALKVRARNQLVQQALAQGTLRQADAKARQLVYALLKNTNYKWITITTVPSITSSGKQ